PGVPLIKDGQAVYGKLQRQHLAFFPEGKAVTEESGRQLRAWARGETLSNAPSRPSSPARASDAGESPPANSSPASVNNQMVLLNYHNALDKAVDRAALVAAHTTYKPNFEGRSDHVQKTAQFIFGAHQDRLKGLSHPDIYEAIEKVPL